MFMGVELDVKSARVVEEQVLEQIGHILECHSFVGGNLLLSKVKTMFFVDNLAPIAGCFHCQTGVFLLKIVDY